MTRDAKLYKIIYTDWKPLIEKIEQHRDFTLKEFVLVYDLSKNHPDNQYYAILSLHEDVDKIVEASGAEEFRADDLLRLTLHDETENPIYGDKSRIIHLKKLNPTS